MRIIKENIEIRDINEPVYKYVDKGKKRKWFDFLRKIFSFQKMSMKTSYKRIIVAILIAALLLFENPFTLALAYEFPTAPTPPPQPENTTTPPAAPTPPPQPENTSTAPAAPTPPPAPTIEEALADPTPTPTPTEEVVEENTTQESENLPEDTGSTESTGDGVIADGNVGDTAIVTGDATNSSITTTSGNDNYSATPNSENGSGATIVNDDNGTGSSNSGSATITDTNTTEQSNSATVGNELNQSTTTGENSASKNVGNSTITTGDANTSGTIINAVNTNVDGIMVSEFNINDDHVGDIILNFDSGCITGCATGQTSVENTNNGSDSANNGIVNSDVTDNTFQVNDADIENNMVLSSDSGSNNTDKNTKGDNSIETGDANVSGNILNFANNNIAGDVVYAVVNIFGNLIGDIILPDGSILSCCAQDTSVQNKDNGSGSENTAAVDQTSSDNIFQSNTADIDNNLILSATTGDNATSGNTGGNNSIETGDTSVLAQVLNVANLNLVGGNYWLVIVNEAGRWVGKILGAPDGSNVYGSTGIEFAVDENGEIFVSNSGNGADSVNAGTVNQDTSNTIVQSNDAKIVNNVNLSANTGGNSASSNTGGDSSIKTGDASIVANIVNFVNNNIVGTGKMFVTVVNVFGSWLGDFVSPGQSKTQNDSQQETAAVGGTSSNNSNSSSSSSSGSNQNSNQASTESDALPPHLVSRVGKVLINSVTLASSTDDPSSSPLNFSIESNAGKKVIKINLAWALLSVPIFLLVIITRRRKFLLRFLPGKRA